MIPAGLLGGIFIVIVSFIFKKGDIFIDFNDILICFLWGAILNGFMNLVFIFSTRHLLASEVTFFMLIEFCLGPIWVWLYFDESLSINSLVGGLIVLFCVSLFTYKEIKTSPDKYVPPTNINGANTDLFFLAIFKFLVVLTVAA